MESYKSESSLLEKKRIGIFLLCSLAKAKPFVFLTHTTMLNSAVKMKKTPFSLVTSTYMCV